jgi:choline kinase
VAGRPILFYQLEALRRNGIRKIGIVLGHAGEKIMDFMGQEFPDFQVHYLWNREYDQSNSSYSFWLARDWIGTEPYVHLNCDIIFSAGLLAKLLGTPQANVIAVRTDVALEGQMEHVQLSEGRITRMSIRNFPEAVGKAFGLAKLGIQSTAFLTGQMEQHLEKGDKDEHYYGLIRRALDNLDYFALDATGALLLEVNTLEDLERAEERVEFKWK